MGWYGSQIGKFKMFLHDSCYDYVKRSKPLEYYENYKLKVEFYRPGKKEPSILELPLTKFGTPKLLKKYYEFDWDIDMHKLLYDEITKRHYGLKGDIYLEHHIGKADPVKYYLHSKMDLDDEITLSSKKKEHFLFRITCYDDLLWIRDNGLIFEQIIHKGEYQYS